MSTPLRWEVFCRVIDNHGDLGVCWRLSCQLADRGHRVRLWVDDATALAWMAPHGHPGVAVAAWPQPDDPAPQPGPDMEPAADTLTPVWLEAFGVDIPEKWIAYNTIIESDEGQKDIKKSAPAAWINLEYLTAEPYAQRCHRLPSPVMSGAAKGLTRHFFYPGFTPATGGLLREPDLSQRQAGFDRSAWLHRLGVTWAGQRVVSLFCYEPAALGAWLRQWAQGSEPTLLLVAPGRPWAAVRQALSSAGHPTLGRPAPGDTPQPHQWGALQIHPLPYLSQPDFDHLLWTSDLNVVRGEDSLVRALWAGRPLVWHIYPQDDGVHWPKLQAFLDWLQAPDDLRACHHHWNGDDASAPPPDVDWARASACVQAARQRLLAQPDLVTQLLAFVGQLCAPSGGAGLPLGPLHTATATEGT